MRKEANVKLLIGDPISRLLDGKLIKSGTCSRFKLVCSISTGFFDAEVSSLNMYICEAKIRRRDTIS